jgi:hypothetical protein
VGSNPAAPTIIFKVHTGDMADILFLRHGLHPRAERVVDWLQGFLLKVDIPQIIIHKTDEPYTVVNFLDSNGLTSKRRAEVYLLAV